MYWKYANAVKELLRNEGMIVLNRVRPDTRKRLDAVISECMPFIAPHTQYIKKSNPPVQRKLPKLLSIYPYYKTLQFSQPTADGLCSYFFNDQLATVGIAMDVIKGDMNYFRLVMLHELAHLTHKDHGPDYVLHLNKMVYDYNKSTGRDLKNDLSYEGFYLDNTGHYLNRADA